MRFPARLTRSEQTPRGVVLASISPVGQPDWGVLVERDRDLAFASVDLMVRDTLIWSAVALAGALMLGLVFARRLSSPIATLAESTRAISEGAYGSTVPVAGTAEIADLSESFNRMSASIRVAFDEVQRAARENRELFLASIRALAEAIDAKDPYTRGHSERVATYAVAVAKEMGLPAGDVEKIRVSALLHDVGKIGVDDRIIRKPTALTEDEFEAMKTHPIKGTAINNDGAEKIGYTAPSADGQARAIATGGAGAGACPRPAQARIDIDLHPSDLGVQPRFRAGEGRRGGGDDARSEARRPGRRL